MLFHYIILIITLVSQIPFKLENPKYFWPLSLLWITMEEEKDGQVLITLQGPSETLVFENCDSW
jgi:hypothetical protein